MALGAVGHGEGRRGTYRRASWDRSTGQAAAKSSAPWCGRGRRWCGRSSSAREERGCASIGRQGRAGHDICRGRGSGRPRRWRVTSHLHGWRRKPTRRCRGAGDGRLRSGSGPAGSGTGAGDRGETGVGQQCAGCASSWSSPTSPISVAAIHRRRRHADVTESRCERLTDLGTWDWTRLAGAAPGPTRSASAVAASTNRRIRRTLVHPRWARYIALRASADKSGILTDDG